MQSLKALGPSTALSLSAVIFLLAETIAFLGKVFGSDFPFKVAAVCISLFLLLFCYFAIAVRCKKTRYFYCIVFCVFIFMISHYSGYLLFGDKGYSLNALFGSFLLFYFPLFLYFSCFFVMARLKYINIFFKKFFKSIFLLCIVSGGVAFCVNNLFYEVGFIYADLLREYAASNILQTYSGGYKLRNVGFMTNSFDFGLILLASYAYIVICCRRISILVHFLVLVLIISTYNRNVILGLFIFYFLYAFCRFNCKFKFLLFSLMMIFSFVIPVFLYAFSDYVCGVGDHTALMKISTLCSRSEAWSAVLSLPVEKMFFGVGLLQGGGVFPETSLWGVDNMYLYSIAQGGVFGFVSLAVTLFLACCFLTPVFSSKGYNYSSFAFVLLLLIVFMGNFNIVLHSVSGTVLFAITLGVSAGGGGNPNPPLASRPLSQIVGG